MISDFLKNYFTPTKDVRFRDILREIPTGIKDVSQNISQTIQSGVNFDKNLVKSTFPGLIALKDSIQSKNATPYKNFLAQANAHISTPQGALETALNFTPIGSVERSIAKTVEQETAQTTIQKLTQAIKRAEPVRKSQEALYAVERSKRIAKVISVGETVGGEKGYFAQLGQLKGQLPKAQFDSVRGTFNQGEIDSLFNTIEQSRTLLPFEKLTAKGGLAKLFEGTVPTRSELELFKQTFPPELVAEILKKRPVSQRIFEQIGQVLNTPRAIMSSFDLSAPLRQGIFLISRPKQFVPAFRSMFKYAFSEKAYQGLSESIVARPTYKLMRQSRLALTDLTDTLTSREEAIMSSLPEKVPGLGKIVRGSNRAYSGFLNKLRADTFDSIVKHSKDIGKELTEQELSDIGRFVNSATGRGSLGVLEKAAIPLNATFFSPRLMASRINLLNPQFYISLSPVARKEALKSLFGFAGIATTVLGIAKLGGATVGADPRSADFGKIKVGNTRYDILGGFQQYIRLAAQLATGEIVSSTTGRTITLGEGYKPLTRKDILIRFFESKESPVASFVTAALQGTTATGENFDLSNEVITRFIPMIVQDMYDITKDGGIAGTISGIPGIFGVGTQTYGKQQLVFGKNPIGEQTSQVRPIPGLSDSLREKIFGMQPLGSSKSFNVEAFYDQLSNLPKQDAADIFEKIAESNPDLAKQIATVVKERELGITPKDKDLKSKGVASGDRALSVKGELDKLKTKEEKALLWQDYVKKGIITKEVGRQLMILLNQ